MKAIAFIPFFVLMTFLNLNAQGESLSIRKIPAKDIPKDIDFERPFNFFLSAGLDYRFNDAFDVTLSAIDYSVQFQSLGYLQTSISAGMVWTPFSPSKGGSEPREVIYKGDEMFEISRNHFAFALLVDVFQLSFSSDDVNPSVPVDVGIGIGLKNLGFLILLSLNFDHIRQPRSYFVDNYLGQNNQLIFAGATEPTQVLDQSDNRLFYNKLMPSLGLKVAYAFVKRK